MKNVSAKYAQYIALYTILYYTRALHIKLGDSMAVFPRCPGLEHLPPLDYGDVHIEVKSLRTANANVNGHETGSVTKETKETIEIRTS